MSSKRHLSGVLVAICHVEMLLSVDSNLNDISSVSKCVGIVGLAGGQ